MLGRGHSPPLPWWCVSYSCVRLAWKKVWDPCDHVVVLCIIRPRCLTLCLLYSRNFLCPPTVALVHMPLRRPSMIQMREQNVLFQHWRQYPRGWCGGSAPVASTMYSGGPWWCTRYRQALDNFFCLLHPLLWGKKTLWRFIYIERLIYFYRMYPFIILLYLTYYRYLTLNLHFYSKTFDHFPFYWSYGADEMTEFVWYCSGGLVVYTNDEVVRVYCELLWFVADVWGFGGWKSGESGADELEVYSALWIFFDNVDGVSSSIGGNVSLAETCVVVCLLMMGPVLLGGMFECCVRFNLGFYPSRNCHDCSYSPFA